MPLRRSFLVRGLLVGAIVTGWVTVFLGPGLAAGKAKRPQAGKAREQTGSAFTLKVPVEVVVVNTIVTDREGNPITGLTVDDFEVYENRKKQAIQSFSQESYQNTQVSMKWAGAADAEEPAQPPGPEKPRLLSLVIDDLTFPPTGSLNRTIKAIRDFVERGLRAENYVSILTASGGYFVPFTQDKELLLEEIDQLHKKLDFSSPLRRPGCITLTDAQAEEIELFGTLPNSRGLEIATAEAEECGVGESAIVSNEIAIERFVRNMATQQMAHQRHRIRRLLDVLRTHIRSLGPVEAQKSLVLLSGGFLHRSLRYELERVIDMALKTGLIFNTVRSSGLEAPAMYDAGQDITVSSSLRLSKSFLTRQDRRQKAVALDYLSKATGGIYFKDNNDLLAGLRKVVDQQFTFYVLSYATPPKKPNGRYYKIRVRVSRPGVRVTHRKGFYAPKERLSPEERTKRELLEAMQAPTNLREIPLQMSYHSSRLDQDTHQLEIVTRIGFQDLPFQVEEGKRLNQIHLTVVAFDEEEEYVGGDEKAWDFKLGESSYNALLQSGLTSKVVLKVPPGQYQVKIAARESLNAGLGSLRQTVEVPVLSAERAKGSQDKTLVRGLQSAEPLQDLPVAFKANAFYEEAERALVLISASLSHGPAGASKERWLPRKGLSLMAVAFSENGQAVSAFGKTIEQATGKQETAFQGYLKLSPGQYRIKMVAADRNDRLGTAEQALRIPVLPPDELASSGLILSQEVEPFSPAVSGLQIPEVRWLFHRGYQVKPSANNEIGDPRPLAVFYKIYNAPDLRNGKLLARIQAVRDTGETTDFPPIALDQNHLEERAPGQVAVGFKLLTNTLNPGNYQLEITTEESDSGRSTLTGAEVVVRQGSRLAKSGGEQTATIGGPKEIEESANMGPAVRLDLNKIRDSLEIPRNSGNSVPAQKYRFRSESLLCASDRGETGYNPDFQGECGDLRGSHVQPGDLRGKNLFGANLSGMDLRKADLRNAVLLRSDLTQTRLWEADLRGADLRGAKLNGAELIKARLEGARLEGADLADSSLTQANLKGASLLGASLQRAILKDARLSEANLQVADLSDAVLFGSDLRRADLRGANLIGAALVEEREAHLFIPLAGDIRINRTRLDGAQYDQSTQLPFDSRVAPARKMRVAEVPSTFNRPDFIIEPGSDEITVNESEAPTIAAGRPGEVPTESNWPDFLEAVRRRVFAYTQNIPGFLCQRRTARFERLFLGWQEKDRLAEELLYLDGQERYQPIQGQGSRTLSGSLEGAYSIGEYASALQTLFAPQTGASFRLEGPEDIAGHRTIRVAYQVPRETSTVQLSYQGNRLVVGYRGLCWIDVKSYQVVRLTKKAVDLPQDFPIKASEMRITYDQIQFGERGHWLPVSAQLNLSIGILDGARLHTRNDVQFSDYRKFETDVKLVLE